MPFNQTDLISIFGRRGTGKSNLCRYIQDAFPRLVIIDLCQEYKKSDCDILVTSFSEFDLALGALAREKSEKFRLVYQFDIEGSDDEVSDFNEAMRLIYYFGNVMCVIEEIHNYTKNEYLPEWLRKMILVGRHRRVGIIATSQRPAIVPKTFVSQCHHVFCGVTFERNDLKYFYETIGDAADILPTLKKFSFLHYCPGEKTKIVKPPLIKTS